MQRLFLFVLLFIPLLCGYSDVKNNHESQRIPRHAYLDKLHGFWLGQSLANWTGLVTEMDKIGGEGLHGQFYTTTSWGGLDEPSIWDKGLPSPLSSTIDWVFETSDGVWGADDDTDIEYMYQFLLAHSDTLVLSPEQIKRGWLKHIYSDAESPHTNSDGEKENYLWVSNQAAFDLMQQGILPPETSDPLRNPHTEMIDAQLTTEIFGLYAPNNPEIAKQLAYLPIRTTARGDAAWIAEFYVVMYSLAASVDPMADMQRQTFDLAEQARQTMSDNGYAPNMYSFVKQLYLSGMPWEIARDSVYKRYQIDQEDGYDMTSKNLYCNGCFAAGINFASSLISWFYGEGNYQKTVKLAVLMGWDSDNPAATWGGLLGFIYGKSALERQFDIHFSEAFNIHRTRRNFPQNGLDNFPAMAQQGINIIDRVVTEKLAGKISNDQSYWLIP